MTECANLKNFLREHGIDINDPANGVPLPPDDHRGPFGIHGVNYDYIEAVTDRLLPLNGSSADAIRAKLAQIGLELFNGTFKF